MAKLPVIGVARFEEASKLLEAVLAEQTDTFLAAQAAFRDKQRIASSRPLTAHEAGEIASAVNSALESGESYADTAAQLQASQLRVSDSPDPTQLLVAGGGATAPAFLDACMRFVVLLELPAEQFKQHRQGGTLADAVRDGADLIRDEDQPMDEARERVGACMEAFAVAAGRPPGEGMRLLAQTAWEALQAATKMATLSAQSSSSLIGSVEPTAGPGTTSPTT